MLNAAGIEAKAPTHGVEYNDASLMLQAAIAGEGVALTRKSLVENDLAQGRLARLFDVEVATPEDYYVVCLPHHAAAQKIATFRDWIRREITWE